MQTRRRAAAVLAGVLVFLALTAEDGCGNGDGKHETPRRPGAGGVQPPAPAKPGAAQPAPVQGDPSAHNEQPGELDLHVEWSGERSPACEWSINRPGVGQQCTDLGISQHEDGEWLGLWEHTVTAKAGDVVFLSAEGARGTKWIKCAYFWKGAYHSLPDSGTRCGGTATLN